MSDRYPAVDLIPMGVQIKMAGAPPKAVAAKVQYAVVMQPAPGSVIQQVGTGELDLGLLGEARLQGPLASLVSAVQQVLREHTGLSDTPPVEVSSLPGGVPMSDHPSPDAPDAYDDDPL